MLNKIIITVVALFLSLSFYGQEYPRYEKDSTGVKYMAITIKQAKYIDNKLDILDLMVKNNPLELEIDSLNIRVIDDLENVILEQTIQIDNLNNLIDNKDEQINNLQSQVANYILREATFESQIENLNEEIKIKDNKIRKLNWKMIWGGVVSVGLIIAGFLLGTSL